MTTVAVLGVNEANIREYVLQNHSDALTQQQIKGVLYDYLEKVIRKPNWIPRWSKELQEDMASSGILQDKTTGLPVHNEGMMPAWSARTRHAESKNLSLVMQNQELAMENQKIVRSLNKEIQGRSIDAKDTLKKYKKLKRMFNKYINKILMET